MSFLKFAKIFGPLSLVLVIASAVLLVKPGLNFSIEFTGGTLMELQLPAEQSKESVEGAIEAFTFADGSKIVSPSLSLTREQTVLVRLQELSFEQHQALMSHLMTSVPGITELQFTTIGPTVGQSLKERSVVALVVAAIAIILYIAFAFRKIPRKYSPWLFGFAAVIAIVHDIMITLGVFVILAQFTSFQVDTLFVSALLSIMGYSVNDTIVIFDRIRDNLIQGGGREDIGAVSERSLRESMSRTLNTGLGALIMLFALYFYGSESIRWFVLALIVGTIVGTYSSFFVATPILVYWKKRK